MRRSKVTLFLLESLTLLLLESLTLFLLESLWFKKRMMGMVRTTRLGGTRRRLLLPRDRRRGNGRLVGIEKGVADIVGVGGMGVGVVGGVLP